MSHYDVLQPGDKVTLYGPYAKVDDVPVVAVRRTWLDVSRSASAKTVITVSRETGYSKDGHWYVRTVEQVREMDRRDLAVRKLRNARIDVNHGCSLSVDALVEMAAVIAKYAVTSREG
jgi:hypothetical protein